MKKITGLIAVLSLLLCMLPVAAHADYSEYLAEPLHSECALLLCTDNDEIIISKNINKQTKPASLTKVITASVILSECKDLYEQFTVPESCITELEGTGSSLGGFKPGEVLTIRDLLTALLVQSANEAATALATWSTGADRQAFIDKMNALAEELGCTNSHFVNVHGLDDEDQYVSCADMAAFFRNAVKYPAFLEITGLISYTLPETNMQKERKLSTTNFTLMPGYNDYYCRYELCGKTGHTSGAGNCLVSKASNNGYNYIAVCMNAEKKDFDNDNVDENGAFLDTKMMYDWAFDTLRLVPIASESKIVGEIPVKYGKGVDTVTLCPSENTYGLMPKGINDSSLKIEIIDSSAPALVKAPVQKGDVICKGKVLFSGSPIAEIDLVSSADIKRSFSSYFGTAIQDVFASPVFKAFAIGVAAVLALLVGLKQLDKKKKREKSNYETLSYNDFKNKRR